MNIRDIARLAGVSVSTVSKVMNKKDASIAALQFFDAQLRQLHQLRIHVGQALDLPCHVVGDLAAFFRQLFNGTVKPAGRQPAQQRH